MGVPRAIRLVCSSWDQVGALLENDLRRGVCRVRLPKQPAVGTEVKIDLGLPSGSRVVIGGQIRRHATEIDDPVRGHGIEVTITHFPPEALFLIENSLKAAREPPPGFDGSMARLGAVALGPDAIDPLADSLVDMSEPSNDTWNEMVVRHDPATIDEDPMPLASTIEGLQAEKLSLQTQDPFEQLGVDDDVTDEEVKAAFYRASRHYSPEALSTYESEEARALAGEIFMLLRDAYRKLSDLAAREHTRKLLRRGGRRAHAIPTATMPEATPPPEAVSNDTEPLMVLPTIGDELTIPEANPRDTHPGGGLSHASLFSDLTFENEVPPAEDPHPTLPGVDQANSLLDSGQFDDALSLVEEVLKQQPSDREARAAREMALGFLSLKNGDRLAAARHFEAALQMIPDSEPAARALDVTRRSQGQSGKAILDRILGKK